MTDPDTTTAQPIPADLGEVSTADDVHVVVFFVGGSVPLELRLPAAEATLLRAVTQATLNQPRTVRVHDGATNLEYTLTVDMIAAVGVPAEGATWRLLLDTTEEGLWAVCDPDAFPRGLSDSRRTDEEGFQMVLTGMGIADRPPAWLRRVARGAQIERVRYRLERLDA